MLLVLGGGAAAWAATAAGSTGYRMARVTRANIQQTMTIVGTVQPVSDASASFQVAGKVATVAATVGEQVTAGQSLGTLDATALSEAVSSAQSTLNADEAKLVQDENSQSSAASNPPSSSTPTSTTTTTTVPASHGGSPGAAQSTVTQAQNTLTQDEAKSVADQQQEAADLAQAQHVCGAGTTTGTTSTTTTTTTPANCQAALGQVSKDQQLVSSDQATVAKDEAALSQALGQGTPSASGGSSAQSAKADAAVTPSATGNTGSGNGSGNPNSNPTGNPTGNGSSPTNAAGNGSGSGSGNGSGSGASSDTPQQIAADQAAIDSAQANLTVAQQSLTEANLTSPISGTVVSVGINVGDTVSAGSSTSVIVIIGTHSYEVVGTLSSSQVPSVKIGDSARVQVDGVSGTIAGTVSQVGPVQSGQSGYSYPLVVALPTSTSGLFSGSSANVVVATGALTNVLAVPTSAVQTLGSRSYVEVLSNGTLIRKSIKVGMVGDTYSQVLSGLGAGQTVVLADYAAPVPSSNTNSLGGFGGGAFGNGGGAFQLKGGGPGPGGAVSVGG